jgi:hypothetical protein
MRGGAIAISLIIYYLQYSCLVVIEPFKETISTKEKENNKVGVAVSIMGTKKETGCCIRSGVNHEARNFMRENNYHPLLFR